MWKLDQKPAGRQVGTSDYEARKERERKRQAAISQSGREIGEIPPIADPERRERCRRSLRAFMETYNPVAFDQAWSPNHLNVIRRIEEAAMTGGLFAFAMPRGSGKTSICRMAALWVISYAICRYVFVIGSNAPKAEETLDAIKIFMRFLPEYAADFPEISVPVRCLAGIANRASGQTCQGESTLIHWAKDRVVLPTVPPPPNLVGGADIKLAPTSGSIIGVSGLTGEGIRGSLHTLLSGEMIRPDFVLLDDPQSDESAWSPTQNRTRESLVSGAVLGMAGPGKQIAAVMPCTVIAPDDFVDRILDRNKHPLWRGERTRMLTHMPENLPAWDKYFEIYRRCAQSDPADYTEANEYYKEHQEVLDKGAEASWPQRKYGQEVSAIQHAMNLYCRSPEAFFAEYQNDPLAATDQGEDRLDADDVAGKAINVARGVAPLNCPRLTAFVDVQGKLLYWLVLAVGEGFTAHVVDYGAWPDQGRNHFGLRDARRTLARSLPGAGQEAQILHGLTQLTDQIMAGSWRREDGSAAEVERLMIDANWGESTSIVYQFCRESPHRARLTPSHGRGIRATEKPMDQWQVSPGEIVGHHWRVRSASKRAGTRFCLYDTNYWKTFAARRLRVHHGDQGALTLYRATPNQHRMIAEQITAESPVLVNARGRRVEEWKAIPNRDNHLLDCLVGAFVAASMLGVAAPGQAVVPVRRKRRKRSVQYL